MAAAKRIAAREDEHWRILRVRRALSDKPEFDWLPNPFGPGGQRLRIRRGGVTVEYALRPEEHAGTHPERGSQNQPVGKRKVPGAKHRQVDEVP